MPEGRRGRDPSRVSFLATARFTINSTPSTPGGYDAAPGETLTLRLEEVVSSEVYQVEFFAYDPDDPESPLATAGAPLLTVTPSSPATVDGSVSIALPNADSHAWIIRCKVNGGVDRATGAEVPAWIFERIVAIRSLAGTGLRKIVPSESTQYSPRGYVDSLDEWPGGLGGGGGGSSGDVTRRTVRCVVLSSVDVASLGVSDYNDGVTVVAGDAVLLVAQATEAQNGPYVVGTPVAGHAPLTRVDWWAYGAVMTAGLPSIKVLEGTVFARTEWEAMPTFELFQVGVSDPKLLPVCYRVEAQLASSQLGIEPAWMGSITAADLERLESGDAGTPGHLKTDRTIPGVLRVFSTSGTDTAHIGITIRNWKG